MAVFEGALCANHDPDIFFVDGRVDNMMKAKFICYGHGKGECPARQECLDFALDFGLEYGVWGGLTPDERKDLS